jgi:putative flippase GtrA
VPDTSPTQPSALRAKIRALVREVGKFGTVGATAFTVDTVLFYLLLEADVETLVAKTIATVISTTVAFLGNRFWTWRHRAHSHMARQYMLFFVFNAIGLGITLGVLSISHYGLGQFWPVLQSKPADLIAGPLVGNAMATLFRFWSYRRFVFPAESRSHSETEREHRSVTSPPSPVRDSA